MSKSFKYISGKCLMINISFILVYQFVISIVGNFDISHTSMITANTNKINPMTNVIEWIDEYSLDNGFKHNFPPFLISFPAAGNTFTRLLLEHTTLYWTGSVYAKCEKINYSTVPTVPLKFQNCADRSVLVIKMHPLGWINTHLKDIMHMNFRYTYENHSKTYTKAQNEQLLRWYAIEDMLNKYNEQISAIFLLRDMFKSCWSYFQFTYAKNFDPEIWTKYAGNLHMGVQNHITSFIMSKDRFESELLSNWTLFSLQCSENWLNEFKWIDKFETNNKTILIVEFGKLLDIKYRQSTMTEMLTFLFTERYLEQHKHEMLIRMEQNIKNMSNMKRSEFIHRIKTRPNRIDANHAYSLLSDDHMCKMLKNARNQSMITINSPRKVNCKFNV